MSIPHSWYLDRRRFIGCAAGGAAMLAIRDLEAVIGPREDSIVPLRILILGGTGFIGPHQVRYAVARGHEVTVFNRGRREAAFPGAVEHLQGDRNGDLESLRNREWDVVIDNPATLPAWVRDTASLLRDRARQYIFISTISVYSDYGRPGMDEGGPLARYTGMDPMAETVESLGARPGELYGPLKVLAEAEAERWFPGRTTVIRPGLIAGPGDPTDRFTYWPVRVARGGEVLVPGAPSDPVQFIDARDLAEWTIRMAEANGTGIYNATGPAGTLAIGEMVESMRPLAERELVFTHVDADFLAAHGVRPWSDMPVWVPPRGDSAGFARIANGRALERGLTFRTLLETARDTLSWHRTRSGERHAQLLAGLPEEREMELLRRWRGRRRG